MRILKLKLRGAIGIKKGLGVDEIEIDFAQLQPGLIALTGHNGSGKTTIMENLHPYRQMVSRDGSLQSHFFLKDSYRILEFEINEKYYRSQIYIDALTGASEAYLFTYEYDNEKGMNVDNEPLNDGKLTTYDTEIEKLLGTPELFFNSVFSGQKSKGIAELKPADRRKLFYELLNLNSYETHLEKAKAELKKKEIKLAEVEGTIKALSENESDINELNDKLEKDSFYLESIDHKSDELKIDIEKIEKIIRDLDIEIHSGEEKLKANEELKTKAADLETEIQNLTNAHNSKISRLNSETEDNKKLIERYEKISANINTINTNLDKIELLNKDLKILQEKKAVLQNDKNEVTSKYTLDISQLSEEERSLNNLNSTISLLSKELDSVDKELGRIEQSTKIIDDSNCDSPTKGTGCNFLINAYAEKETIPTLKQKLIDISNNILEKEKTYDANYNSYSSRKQLTEENYSLKISELNSSLVDLNKQIETINKSLEEINKSDWKKLKSEADSATNSIKLCEEKISSIKKQHTELTENYNSQIERITKEINELNSKIDLQLEEKLVELNSSKQFNTNTLSDLKTSLNNTNEQLSECKSKLAQLEQQIKDAEVSQQKIGELNSLKTFVESEIKDWTFLCRAFDKTGIPVLKLENSGIEITTIANELLSLFENKFRIVFETTSLTKDKKKMKETFDINIVEEDGVCEIGNKSGGQQVWIETAIQLAIMILLSQQGKKAETAFLDEKDGALDLDNAFAYIEMLKKAHQMSGVYNTFVITHRTELLDFIPQQIKLGNGILEIMN